MGLPTVNKCTSLMRNAANRERLCICAVRWYIWELSTFPSNLLWNPNSSFLKSPPKSIWESKWVIIDNVLRRKLLVFRSLIKYNKPQKQSNNYMCSLFRPSFTYPNPTLLKAIIKGVLSANELPYSYSPWATIIWKPSTDKSAYVGAMEYR